MMYGPKIREIISDVSAPMTILSVRYLKTLNPELNSDRYSNKRSNIFYFKPSTILSKFINLDAFMSTTQVSSETLRA